MKKLTANHATRSVLFFKVLFFFGVLLTAIQLKAQPQVTFSPLIQNLTLPIEVTNANDGSGRLFIVEQTGIVKIYKNGSLLSKPFLDLSDIVSNTDTLKGMWSIAFVPNYKALGYFFVYYTSKGGNTVIARYQASKSNPDSAIKNSGVTLFSFPSSGFNGPKFGQFHFGADGYLYFTVSDGSSPSLTTTFAQDLSLYFGKMMRIDVRLKVAPYYTVPPTNPFVNTPNAKPEIFALGFRNAWRWSFDRENGNMWIADVGGERFEEINVSTPVQQGGMNYGWPCYESNVSYVPAGCKNINRYTFPVFNYPHFGTHSGQAIIGGYVYRGSANPALKGYYICSDYSTADLWKIIPNGAGGYNSFKQSGIPPSIAGYGEGEDFELYAASLDGVVYKVQAAAPATVAAANEAAIIAANGKTVIYPTLVDNSIVMLELKEAYDNVKIFDINGREVMRKSLTNQTGRINLNLPKLNAGMYVVQLTGDKAMMQQKIYISK
ncbi:MAG TPA: PQQ-dependent sugar dehydrogenase [Panacibacter sp.]|nr:PQQ-dependent sugar dehydrogenase [Panacibacter sp.]